MYSRLLLRIWIIYTHKFQPQGAALSSHLIRIINEDTHHKRGWLENCTHYRDRVENITQCHAVFQRFAKLC